MLISNVNSSSEVPASEFLALLAGMRESYFRGENAMEFARKMLDRNDNLSAATLISYDLQAGAYIRDALSDPDGRERWCAQIANLLEPYISKDASVMEVGSGEHYPGWSFGIFITHT